LRRSNFSVVSRAAKNESIESISLEPRASFHAFGDHNIRRVYRHNPRASAYRSGSPARLLLALAGAVGRFRGVARGSGGSCLPTFAPSVRPAFQRRALQTSNNSRMRAKSHPVCPNLVPTREVLDLTDCGASSPGATICRSLSSGNALPDACASVVPLEIARIGCGRHVE
jgi:hypothetical protein